MAKVPSKKWQPSHKENQKGLFPHLSSELIIKSQLWTWERPDWAKDPKYENWQKLEREEIDEWGTIWRRGGVKTMGHPGRPSLLNYDNLDEYLKNYTPILNDVDSYSFFLKLSKTIGKNKYRMALLDLGPLHIAANMRGFTNFLSDHRRNKKELKQLLEYLTDYIIKFEKIWVELGVNPHGFILYEDFGSQKGPFFSPKIFKEFYEPVYKRIIDVAHDLGCEFHLHSCGKIDPLIPFLIEWGLDAIEFDSPRMTGYTNLNKFRGKLMMWGCINIQSVYTKGTPEECEREVWHMIRNLGTPHGGYGAYFYPQVDHIQAPKANIDAFNEGLKKFGSYSKIPTHWWDYPIIDEWKDDEVPALPPFNP